MIPHPDQSNTRNGDLRFIQSFRAVGEGHISSILFGEGVIKKDGNIIVKKNSQFLNEGKITYINDSVYEINFSKDSEISSRTIFPVVENEKMGLEDVRFVKFGDGSFPGEDK
jgi:hypothetical protein